MKPKPSVSYFPVDPTEQELLLRLREPDFAGLAADALALVDILAAAKLGPADLEQAVALLEATRQGENLDARFANLEARLVARIEKGLAEIEGRLSKRVAELPEPAQPTINPPPPIAPRTVSPKPPAPPPASPPVAVVPPEANVAFRIAGELVWGPSAAQFYIAVWRWLFTHGHVSLADLPIGTAGKKRYEVAATPFHPPGNEFYRAEQPVPGAFLEVNLSRANIIQKAQKYLTRYNVPFEVVVGSDT